MIKYSIILFLLSFVSLFGQETTAISKVWVADNGNGTGGKQGVEVADAHAARLQRHAQSDERATHQMRRRMPISLV